MEFDEFNFEYLKLSKVHQEIIFEFLRRLEEPLNAQKKFDKSNKVMYDIGANIKRYKKQKKSHMKKYVMLLMRNILITKPIST